MNNREWKHRFRDRLIKFSVAIIHLANNLPKSPAGYAIAGQVIRSGTSIGANFEEAQDASSAKDFIHKLSISLRESRETNYWLSVIQSSELLKKSSLEEVKKENNEITAILVSTMKSLNQKG